MRGGSARQSAKGQDAGTLLPPCRSTVLPSVLAGPAGLVAKQSEDRPKADRTSTCTPLLFGLRCSSSRPVPSCPVWSRLGRSQCDATDSTTGSPHRPMPPKRDGLVVSHRAPSRCWVPWSVVGKATAAAFEAHEALPTTLRTAPVSNDANAQGGQGGEHTRFSDACRNGSRTGARIHRHWHSVGVG